MISMAFSKSPDGSVLVNNPFLSTVDAATVFTRLYGMPKPTLVKELDGYDSQNFLLKLGDDRSRGSNKSTHTASKYVLKIMCSEDSKDNNSIRAIHSVQRYLNQQGFMCAVPLQNIYGDDMKLEEFSQTSSTDSQYQGRQVYGQFMVRAYPFITGTTLNNVTPANSTQLFYELGKTLAKFHQILQSYPDSVASLKKRAESFYWTLTQVPKILKIIAAVEDGNKQDLVMDVVKTFQSKVLSGKAELRSGIVHGDFSHTNIVVSPEIGSTLNNIEEFYTPGPKTNYKLCGVIDFDDCNYNCLVFDIAISMAYISMSKAAEDQPLLASGALLAGYQSITPLTPVELEVLGICQAARYAQSLVLGLHEYKLQPENDYLLDSQISWPILEQLWKMDSGDVQKMWKAVATQCVQFEKQVVL